MIQRMLAIWSLVPLSFLNPAWTAGSSQFTYCWSLARRILSITLIACEMNAINCYGPQKLLGLSQDIHVIIPRTCKYKIFMARELCRCEWTYWHLEGEITQVDCTGGLNVITYVFESEKLSCLQWERGQEKERFGTYELYLLLTLIMEEGGHKPRLWVAPRSWEHPSADSQQEGDLRARVAMGWILPTTLMSKNV